MTTPKFKKFGQLIKWPQCVMVGKPVTIEQAKEILSRTDMFFQGFGSNARSFDNAIWDEIGIEHSYQIEDLRAYYKRKYNFAKKHKLIDLEYLYNGYISNCYVGGCHGWCHPNGTIHFRDNIGKWPEWNEIYKECKTLAKAFPFLDMQVYLFNQEHDCEDMYDYPKRCVGGFKLKNGRIYLLNKNEFMDANAKETKSPYTNYFDYMYQQKRDIFGNKADTEVFNKYHGEVFFNEEEFREYFKGYYY
jgi:hypothetical protein